MPLRLASHLGCSCSVRRGPAARHCCFIIVSSDIGIVARYVRPPRSPRARQFREFRRLPSADLNGGGLFLVAITDAQKRISVRPSARSPNDARADRMFRYPRRHRRGRGVLHEGLPGRLSRGLLPRSGGDLSTRQSVGRGRLARGQPMPWGATRRHRAVGNRALPLRLRPEVCTLDNVVGQP